ncbi:oligosaccharide flippase family protein [uncultured Varibaculum sp.]|uniref:lipopolysaccharide biosynthesis protein n=1 Tax=uncultured Varibaculum sp. TaxID=413896 RepID=UPI0027D977BB|nr:oligosaccharide flippase family protein [uncultured Varibaculum sp.]
MVEMLRRIRDLIRKSPTAKHVSTLLSGTVIAQLLALVTAPLISRLYSPTEIGVYTLFTSVVATVVAVAGLRYDLGIVLPKSHGNARLLRNTVTVIIFVVSICVTLFMIPFAGALAKWLGNPELAPWLIYSGLAVFTLSQVNSFNYWFTRTLQYRVISINRVQMSGSIAISQIVFSLCHLGGVAGLVIGHILGQSLAAGTLMWKGRKQVEGETAPSLTRIQLLKRYKKMPLINGPNALVDAIRLNGIMMMIGALFSTDAVGQFGQAWRLMQAPVSLITGAISQVFYQKFASTEKGNMTALVKTSVKLSLIAGFLPFAVIAIIAPWLFPWFLGSQWNDSGLIGQALVPWLYLNVATSPISTVFLTIDRQQVLFGFAVSYMAVGLGAVYIGTLLGWSLVATTWLLSICMAICLALMIVLAFWSAKKYDAEV